jgi:4-hydroxy-tetrahydrodipicolinate synthase
MKGSFVARSDLLVRGVIPPIVTPLTPDREVDVESLRNLVDFQVEAGVHAIFALGTGGEGPYATARTRDTVLDVVTEQVNGRVPVLAGISDISTARATEHLRAAERAGVDGVVSTPPFYGEVGQAEIVAHYRSLAGATDLPLIAYDIPSKVHCKISAETTIALARDGVLRAIKDTSGDEDGLRTVIRETADVDGFTVLTGSDITGDAAILQGAHGMIVGVGNIDPHGFVRVYDHATAGDWEKARIEQERLHRLRDVARVASTRIGPFSATIAAFKAAMVERAIIRHDALHLPLLPLDDPEKAEIARILARADLAAVRPA